MKKVFFKLLLAVLYLHSRVTTTHRNAIVLCCPLFIGDMVFTFPLLRGLRKKYPDCKIIFLCRREFQYLLTLNPDIDLVLPIAKSPQQVLAAYPHIRQARYFFTPLADYWIRLGHAVNAKKIGTLGRRVLVNDSRSHIAEQLLSLLGEDREVEEYAIHGPYVTSQASSPNLVIIQCDGRNKTTKSFTQDQLDRLLSLVKQYAVDVHLMGMYAGDPRMNEKNVVDFRGVTQFDDWLNSILQASLVIGFDSAAAQIRKAVGKPACILMGPAAADFFGNTHLFPKINITYRGGLVCRDRNVFQGTEFKNLQNCQRAICQNLSGRVCVEGEVFDRFIDEINRELSQRWLKIV